MTHQAFVDESKVGGLSLYATVIGDGDVVSARARVSDLRAKGTARLHFRQDNDRVKSRALTVMKTLPMSVFEVDVRHLGAGLTAREAGLRFLVPRLARFGVRLLVLEQDDSLLKHDKRWLYEITKKELEPAVRPMEYRHLRASQEPMLWVSDAAAWCMRQRCRRWRDEFSPLVRCLPDAA